MRAVAQAPVCPDVPAAYEGADELLAAIRALRSDVVASCSATADRLDVLHADLGSALAVTLPAEPLAVAVTGQPLDVVGEVDATVTNPGESTDVAPVVEAVELSNEAVRSALWFLAGLLTLLVAAPVVVREFRA